MLAVADPISHPQSPQHTTGWDWLRLCRFFVCVSVLMAIKINRRWRRFTANTPLWFPTHRSLGGVLVELPPKDREGIWSLFTNGCCSCCISKLNVEFRMSNMSNWAWWSINHRSMACCNTSNHVHNTSYIIFADVLCESIQSWCEKTWKNQTWKGAQCRVGTPEPSAGLIGVTSVTSTKMQDDARPWPNPWSSSLCRRAASWKVLLCILRSFAWKQKLESQKTIQQICWFAMYLGIIWASTNGGQIWTKIYKNAWTISKYSVNDPQMVQQKLSANDPRPWRESSIRHLRSSRIHKFTHENQWLNMNIIEIN